MTADWLKYTEGVNHHTPYKSYQRGSRGRQKQEHFEDSRFKKPEREESSRMLFECQVQPRIFFCSVFMN